MGFTGVPKGSAGSSLSPFDPALSVQIGVEGFLRRPLCSWLSKYDSKAPLASVGLEERSGSFVVLVSAEDEAPGLEPHG